jgi:hypothetical protein|tara:strand:- start:424 stop:732 length:309 start_codon:yes stop_codon:yes gene_type:complete
MSYAIGKFALAHCDRCGFRYKLLELRKEWNGLKTCPECYEEKHPQLEPPTNVADAEALYDPRPDNDKENTPGRVFTNTDTIGSNFDGFSATSSLGSVTITTS